jgi:hypothetical protein
VRTDEIVLEVALAYKPKNKLLTISANTTVDFALTRI